MAKTKTATVTPLGDRVLVKRVQADEKTKGGIILPDTAKEKPREGLVVAVGKGKLLDNGSRQALQVKTNDRVLFSSYAGSEIKLDGEELLILGEDEILAGDHLVVFALAKVIDKVLTLAGVQQDLSLIHI